MILPSTDENKYKLFIFTIKWREGFKMGSSKSLDHFRVDLFLLATFPNAVRIVALHYSALHCTAKMKEPLEGWKVLSAP